MHRDSEKTKQELEKIERGSSRAFDAFIAEAARIYDTVRPLMNNCYTKKALINPQYWLLIKKLRALESYWKFAKRYFSSEKLCYAFTFESMFIGVSPFEAPVFQRHHLCRSRAEDLSPPRRHVPDPDGAGEA